MAELPEGAMQPGQAAAIASGVRLRAYKFDRYKTKKKDGEEKAAARRCLDRGRGCGRGERRPLRRTRRSSTASFSRAISSTSRRTCSIPRNSPAAPRSCEKLGVEVEVLDVKAMTKLGMGALLGVGQGSARDRAAP